MPATNKKKLAPNCQKAPAVDAKAKGLWPPKGGTAYQVQDGDNLVALAKAWKVTPRELIGFNFNSDNPQEVNWYLDNYVGCVLHTDDCCNWRFSSDAKPGIIYRPWAGYPAAPGDPVRPQPPLDPDPIQNEQHEFPMVTTNFSIRMLGSGSVPLPKIAVGVDCIFFQIRNHRAHRNAYYRYTGIGLGVGIKKISASFEGPWERFTTSGPILETDFEGFTRFTSAGGGTASVDILHLLGTPPGIAGVYLNVPSGFTAGFGASFTVGEMILM